MVLICASAEVLGLFISFWNSEVIAKGHLSKDLVIANCIPNDPSSGYIGDRRSKMKCVFI